MTIFAGKKVAEMQEINAKTVDKNLILLLRTPPTQMESIDIRGFKDFYEFLVSKK
jgi:hypothetical protein